MRVYTSSAVFLFFAISLIVPGGFSAGPLLLLLAGIVLYRTLARSALGKPDYQMIAVLTAYFLICASMNLIHGAPIAEYDAPFRFLLAVPVLILLLAYPPSAVALWGGLVAGSAGAGIFAAWQKLTSTHMRAEGFTNPIQYGNISILLGMLCLAGIEWSAQQRRSRFLTVLLLIGAVCGISGSIFTESRGSWLALPVCLMALYCGSALKKRYLIVGTIAMTAWLFALYAIPQTGIKERLSLVASETSAYNDANEVTTSVGGRLEMWRAGALLIREKPLLGWGKEGYMNRVQQWIAKGEVGEIVGQHSHLHNEYIDAWVKRGIPGLAATLALYLIPLLLFTRQFRRTKAATRPYALAGIMLTLSYIAFGLTQAFLTHDNGVMLYAFSAAILWAAARRAESAL